MSKELHLPGVYIIRAPSGKAYVGMTSRSFQIRWKRHLVLLRSGKHHNAGLQSSFSCYGESGLVFSILETFDSSTPTKIILKQEQVWWLKLRSEGVHLYNSEPSGTGSRHFRHTPETIEAIREKALLHGEKARAKRILEKCANPACEVIVSSKPSRIQLNCSVNCDRTNRHRGTFSQLTKVELVRLYVTENMTAAKLAKMHNCSVELVKLRLRENNVTKSR